MKKKILSLIMVLVLLVSISAVFGFFHKKITTTKKIDTEVTSPIPTSTEGSPRCVVLQYPKDYISLTGNTFCASNDNRECVHIAEYRQDKRFSLWTAPDGKKVYMPTTGIRDCSDSLSGGNPPGISSIGGGPVKEKNVDRFATCCRFN